MPKHILLWYLKSWQLKKILLLKRLGLKNLFQALPGFFVVLILVTIPGKDLPTPDNWMIAIDYDKLIHIGVFGFLAFLFMCPFGKSLLPPKQKTALFYTLCPCYHCLGAILPKYCKNFTFLVEATTLQTGLQIVLAAY